MPNNLHSIYVPILLLLYHFFVLFFSFFPRGAVSLDIAPYLAIMALDHFTSQFFFSGKVLSHGPTTAVALPHQPPVHRPVCSRATFNLLSLPPARQQDFQALAPGNPDISSSSEEPLKAPLKAVYRLAHSIEVFFGLDVDDSDPAYPPPPPQSYPRLRTGSRNSKGCHGAVSRWVWLSGIDTDERHAYCVGCWGRAYGNGRNGFGWIRLGGRGFWEGDSSGSFVADLGVFEGEMSGLGVAVVVGWVQ
ncbi:hypothetical protein GQ43DRAFT_496390 [Delitschia confertaspora ATCC 74209]|uniref:Uncharacterized protein n=1 Tax=Delitschia confertaspora ATCC 74209 TaxID=1513339 RepID=A0A9P4JIJ3_9PLEO|nr:hypothetical protein GQ43DRAFT_496390 [Delitschia confertaspora ATCC 74209]